MTCPYCHAPGHDESRESCPQRKEDAVRCQWDANNAAAIRDAGMEAISTKEGAHAFARAVGLQSHKKLPGALLATCKWCAMCGKWGDHMSGACPVFAQMPQEEPDGWKDAEKPPGAL